MPPSAVQKAAAQSGGIATGIDPGIVRSASIECIAPQAPLAAPSFPQ